MQLEQIDVTGCRIVGAITKELGHAGPKHHGVILGRNLLDQEIYIAESMHFGYQICTYADFLQRYSENGAILIQPNDGGLENLAVAQRAINELSRNEPNQYNLITNNCECFVNRAMHDRSLSNQVINTAIGFMVLVGFVYIIKKNS